ncbi:MAG: NAD-dependent epimerase/dehydratase family protein [Candidatus Micrarchaeaceae archaeon]
MSETRTPRQARKTVLVTGATSGIGRLLVEELVKRYNVRVILRKPPSAHAEWKELPSGVSVFVVDIASNSEKDRGAIFDACKGASIMFHLAAATRNYSYRYANERMDTKMMINTNVIGTENVLQAFADANPDAKLRFIYASSVAVYGNRRGDEVLTEDSEPMPRSAYSESKYMAEQVVKAFASARNRITYTILRIAVVYGDGYDSSFMRVFKMIKERKLRYVGSGTNHITLISVDDVVRAMIKVMDAPKSGNKVYNLTDGVRYTQKMLFQNAAKLLGAPSPAKSIHPFLARIGARTRGMDQEEFNFLVSDRIISIEKIKREVGFRPAVDNDIAFKELADRFLSTYKK